ncbi:hypothetical protein BsWGS_25247 [Bradybaena similaris]
MFLPYTYKRQGKLMHSAGRADTLDGVTSDGGVLFSRCILGCKTRLLDAEMASFCLADVPPATPNIRRRSTTINGNLNKGHQNQQSHLMFLPWEDVYLLLDSFHKVGCLI